MNDANELKIAAEQCDEIADELKAISEGVRHLLAGKLNDRALMLLLVAACPTDARGRKPSQKTIRLVLEGVMSLDKKFVKGCDDDD